MECGARGKEEEVEEEGAVGSPAREGEGERGVGGWVVDRERRVNLSREGREKRTGPKGSKPRKIQRGSADSIGGKRTRGPSDRIEAARAPRSVVRYPRRVARHPSTPPPPRMFSFRATTTTTTTTTVTTTGATTDYGWCCLRWHIVDRLSRVFLQLGRRELLYRQVVRSIEV